MRILCIKKRETGHLRPISPSTGYFHYGNYSLSLSNLSTASCIIISMLWFA